MAHEAQLEKSRAGLLRTMREQHAALEAQLDGLSADEMTRLGVTDGWSVKDHLVHLTWWEQRTIRLLGGALDPIDSLPNMRNEDGNFEDDRVNAFVREAKSARPLADVRADFDASFAELLALIETMPDDVVAAKYDWISGDTNDHYDEHARSIRAWRERA
jgi:Protein of unknown function (DUF1706)